MNRTEIPIASPCHADWTRMTLADRGRFCGECRKVVRDLEQMSEKEARALLAAPATEGLCVRYVHDATGEIVFRRDVVPVGRLVRARRVAAAAFAAASLPLAVAGCMGAAPPPPPAVPTMGAVAPAETTVMMGSPLPATQEQAPPAPQATPTPSPEVPLAR